MRSWFFNHILICNIVVVEIRVVLSGSVLTFINAIAALFYLLLSTSRQPTEARFYDHWLGKTAGNTRGQEGGKVWGRISPTIPGEAGRLFKSLSASAALVVIVNWWYVLWQAIWLSCAHGRFCASEERVAEEKLTLLYPTTSSCILSSCPVRINTQRPIYWKLIPLM